MLLKSVSCVCQTVLSWYQVTSDFFLYYYYFRAKLGYGLLSGEYSKPAPDPGEENESSEPRVRGDGGCERS